jgi:hypothetical protein
MTAVLGAFSSLLGVIWLNIQAVGMTPPYYEQRQAEVHKNLQRDLERSLYHLVG